MSKLSKYNADSEYACHEDHDLESLKKLGAYYDKITEIIQKEQRYVWLASHVSLQIGDQELNSKLFTQIKNVVLEFGMHKNRFDIINATKYWYGYCIGNKLSLDDLRERFELSNYLRSLGVEEMYRQSYWLGYFKLWPDKSKALIKDEVKIIHEKETLIRNHVGFSRYLSSIQKDFAEGYISYLSHQWLLKDAPYVNAFLDGFVTTWINSRRVLKKDLEFTEIYTFTLKNYSKYTISQYPKKVRQYFAYISKQPKWQVKILVKQLYKEIYQTYLSDNDSRFEKILTQILQCKSSSELKSFLKNTTDHKQWRKKQETNILIKKEKLELIISDFQKEHGSVVGKTLEGRSKWLVDNLKQLLHYGLELKQYQLINKDYSYCVKQYVDLKMRSDERSINELNEMKYLLDLIKNKSLEKDRIIKQVHRNNQKWFKEVETKERKLAQVKKTIREIEYASYEIKVSENKAKEEMRRFRSFETEIEYSFNAIHRLRQMQFNQIIWVACLSIGALLVLIFICSGSNKTSMLGKIISIKGKNINYLKYQSSRPKNAILVGMTFLVISVAVFWIWNSSRPMIDTIMDQSQNKLTILWAGDENKVWELQISKTKDFKNNEARFVKGTKYSMSVKDESNLFVKIKRKRNSWLIDAPWSRVIRVKIENDVVHGTSEIDENEISDVGGKYYALEYLGDLVVNGRFRLNEKWYSFKSFVPTTKNIIGKSVRVHESFWRQEKQKKTVLRKNDVILSNKKDAVVTYSCLDRSGEIEIIVKVGSDKKISYIEEGVFIGLEDGKYLFIDSEKARAIKVIVKDEHVELRSRKELELFSGFGNEKTFIARYKKLNQEFQKYIASYEDVKKNDVNGLLFYEFMIKDVLCEYSMKGGFQNSVIEIPFSQYEKYDKHGSINYWTGNVSETLRAFMKYEEHTGHDMSREIWQLVKWIIDMQTYHGAYYMKKGYAMRRYRVNRKIKNIGNSLIAFGDIYNETKVKLLRGYEYFWGMDIELLFSQKESKQRLCLEKVKIIDEEGKAIQKSLGIKRTYSNRLDARLDEEFKVKHGFSALMHTLRSEGDQKGICDDLGVEYTVYDKSRDEGMEAIWFPGSGEIIGKDRDGGLENVADITSIYHEQNESLLAVYGWDKFITIYPKLKFDKLLVKYGEYGISSIVGYYNKKTLLENRGKIPEINYNVFWANLVHKKQDGLPVEMELMVKKWKKSIDLHEPDFLSYETDYAYQSSGVALAEAASYWMKKGEKAKFEISKCAALKTANYSKKLYSLLYKNNNYLPVYGIMRFYGYHVAMYAEMYGLTGNKMWLDELFLIADNICKLQNDNPGENQYGGFKQNELPSTYQIDDQGTKLWALRIGYDFALKQGYSNKARKYQTTAERCIEHWPKVEKEKGNMFWGWIGFGLKTGEDEQRSSYGQANMLMGLAAWLDINGDASLLFDAGLDYFIKHDDYQDVRNVLYGFGLSYSQSLFQKNYLVANTETLPLALLAMFEAKEKKKKKHEVGNVAIY